MVSQSNWLNCILSDLHALLYASLRLSICHKNGEAKAGLRGDVARHRPRSAAAADVQLTVS